MNNLLLAIILLLFPCRFANSQETTTRHGRSDVSRWVEDNFAKNKIPPFSFVYGGKSSDTFIRNWHYQAETKTSAKPDVEESVYTYTDKKSGLVVKCFVTCFNDFQAVEWVLRFSNTSGKNSPVIEKAAVIDYSFTSAVKGPFILHHARGSTAERADFRPFYSELEPGKNIYMTPDRGRSSDGILAFPFFNIESPAKEGVMVAIGWTGKWYADIQQKDDRSVALKSGMEIMQLSLFPGEEIRTPKICLLFWKGEDRMIGHNQFRRFIMAHHTRMIDGKPAELPIAASLAGTGAGPFPCEEFVCHTESYSLAAIARYKQFDLVPEAFWIDAGWYPLPEGCDGRWPNVGTWEVNKKNFPNGLKPVSEAAHEAGAKFLLWFEPERVSVGSEIDIEYPEWVTEVSMPNALPYRKLFNLGNKEALNWITDRISDIIREEGIDIYRQDFNFNINNYPYWEKLDKPQRIGISEIRHIEGLYAFWDSLLVRFPNLIIDNCASGGRRLDLETTSRSSPLYRTDFYSFKYPNGSQDHTYGLNFYLPLHGTATVIRSQYHFRSNLSSAIVLSWDINNGEHSVEEMQRYMNEFKRLRPFFSYGDYYPLTGLSCILEDDTWMAYQLNRPENGDGVILAFRREGNRNRSIRINPKGLNKESVYEIFYEDYGIKENKTGSELMEGIEIFIPTKPASLLISYKVKE